MWNSSPAPAPRPGPDDVDGDGGGNPPGNKEQADGVAGRAPSEGHDACVAVAWVAAECVIVRWNWRLDSVVMWLLLRGVKGAPRMVQIWYCGWSCPGGRDCGEGRR